MSVESPTYLATLQNNIRQRPIPWDGAVRAGTVTEDHLSKIWAVDKSKKYEERRQIVENDLNGYVQLFVGSGPSSPGALELAAKQTNILQYLLVLMGDLIESSPALSRALFVVRAPYDPILPLLAHSNNPEDPIPLLTSNVLANLMCSSRDESHATIHHALPILLTHLSGLTKSTDAGLQDAAVQQYSYLLYSNVARRQFWGQRSETVEPLVTILRASTGVSAERSSASLWNIASAGIRTPAHDGHIGGGVGLQLLYHVLLVMWQLSFDAEEIGDDLDYEYDFVVLYNELLRLSPKEKTTRLIVSTLFNLLKANQKTLLPVAVLARLPALVDNLSGRKLTDTDLLDDLSRLKEILDEYTKTKTTFDEYIAEVRSGHLRWSPPHRNQTFWTENARKIAEHENGAILQKLAEIMKQPWDNDKQVLAIACNDIGFLVKEIPEKRYHLQRLGLKARIMELMQENNETVRWESLKALGSWLKYSFETQK